MKPNNDPNAIFTSASKPVKHATKFYLFLIFWLFFPIEMKKLCIYTRIQMKKEK